MNPNRKRLPFSNQPMPQTAAQPRIIIEVDPNGNSKMTVSGGLNMIGVALTLSSQLNNLLPNLFQQAFKASKVMDANGNPVMSAVPDTMEIQTEPEGEVDGN